MSLVEVEVFGVESASNPDQLYGLLKRQLSGELPVFIDDCGGDSNEALDRFTAVANNLGVDQHCTYETWVGQQMYESPRGSQENVMEYGRYSDRDRGWHVDGTSIAVPSPRLPYYFDMISGLVEATFIPILPREKQTAQWHENVIQEYKSGLMKVDTRVLSPVAYQTVLKIGQRLSFLALGDDRTLHKFHSLTTERKSTSTVFKVSAQH